MKKLNCILLYITLLGITVTANTNAISKQKTVQLGVSVVGILTIIIAADITSNYFFNKAPIGLLHVANKFNLPFLQSLLTYLGYSTKSQSLFFSTNPLNQKADSDYQEKNKENQENKNLENNQKPDIKELPKNINPNQKESPLTAEEKQNIFENAVKNGNLEIVKKYWYDRSIPPKIKQNALKKCPENIQRWMLDQNQN